MIGINDDLLSEISPKPCLYQNYPNPFNSSTKISYTLNGPDFVTLNIYDRLGRKIKSLANEFKSTNTYSIDIDGSGLESGIYFYKLKIGVGCFEVKKMILIK